MCDGAAVWRVLHEVRRDATRLPPTAPSRPQRSVNGAVRLTIVAPGALHPGLV